MIEKKKQSDIEVIVVGGPDSESLNDECIYEPNEKLEYLFPLSAFQTILDNLCYQQVIDLYYRVSNDAGNDHQELSQIDRECVWKIKHGCCEASTPTTLPQYKEVFKLVIQDKFNETNTIIEHTQKMYQEMFLNLEKALDAIRSNERKGIDIEKMLKVTK